MANSEWRMCFCCGKLRATLPKEDPVFCSVLCGYYMGLSSSVRNSWCPTCQEWYCRKDWPKGCPDCTKQAPDGLGDEVIGIPDELKDKSGG